MTTTNFRDHTAELGIVELRRVCAMASQICREVLFRDVGIDAFIEIVQDYKAQGKLIGVQVKSGSSYVSRNRFSFTTNYEHLAYWSKCCFPVIGVIHDPKTKKTVWIDISSECTTRRFQQRDFRLCIDLDERTVFSPENLLGAIRDIAYRYYGEQHTELDAPSILQLEPAAQESEYETWFRLIGTLIGPATSMENAAKAAYRLSYHMPMVNSEQKAAVASAIPNISDFQLLKLIATVHILLEHDDSHAAQHIVDLLECGDKIFNRIEYFIQTGMIPPENLEAAVQMIEVHCDEFRNDLRCGPQAP